MRLIGDEDAAESGVDIIASPPGKRLQNIALLSGGEKSLTAIALLMATFRYRPSPFCVLDEVDAPLDEPNLVRFSRLIRQMSETTQFIIITHSKTTMESAQTLYGVTMQQRACRGWFPCGCPPKRMAPLRGSRLSRCRRSSPLSSIGMGSIG